MHSLLNSNWLYVEESLDEFRARYSGFASGFYDYLAQQMPDRFRELQLYRDETSEFDDSFAVCETEHPFAIQLDPDIEVICLWDSERHTEIGTWSPHPYEEAVAFIRSNFM